jgi:hypothetical protein
VKYRLALVALFVAVMLAITISNVAAQEADAPTMPAKGPRIAPERRKPSPATTTPPKTTTTITVAIPETALCGQWWPLAASVGWPVEELPMLDRVIWRESRCLPDAFNGHDGVASKGTADAGPSDMERVAMPTGCVQRPRRRPNTNQPNPPRVCRRYGMDLAPGPIPTRARPAVLSQIVARFRVAAVGILIRACATVISLCATVVIVNHYIRKGPDNDRSADSATPPRVKQD